MLTSTNPENERIRAQAMLSSFTDQKNAVELFGSRRAKTQAQVETAEFEAKANPIDGRFITQVFKAIKLNRRSEAQEPVQQPAFLQRKVTTPDCP